MSVEQISFEKAYMSEASSLLRTKLFMPPSHAKVIDRTALIERLNRLGWAKLVLICAPAGFGKTTLVANWLGGLRARTGDFRSAWLSLEEADNDLGRFWKYFVAALQTIDPCGGLKLTDMLSRPNLPPPETWLPLLLNDFEKVPVPFTLVLDDYQTIHTRAIHQSLNYLLHHLPANARVVIITRADPPLSLARLRVSGDVVEFRAADLLFTRSEIEEYLNINLGLGLSSDDIDRLSLRTEGWPAGIQLAARSLMGCDDTRTQHEFIRCFSGSNQYVLSYLLEEVLQQRPAAVREFMLRTSILSQLSVSLCASVTGQSIEHVTQFLSSLERDHLFIVPLDDIGHWFRYHALFAEALETQLNQSYPSLWITSHHRACDWYSRNGYPELAIRHALAGHDDEAAATLIENTADPTWMAGDISSPLRWIQALPSSIINQRMILRLRHIWLLILNDQGEEATTQWREIGRAWEAATPPPSDPQFGLWAAIGGALAVFRNSPEEAAHLAQQALDLLPPDERLWRAVSRFNLGLAYQAQGLANPAADTFRMMIDQCLELGIPYLAFAALAHLVEVHHTQGRLYEAQAHCEQLEVMPDVRTSALRAGGTICRGRLLYERNVLAAAERLMDEAIDHIWSGGQPRQALMGWLILSRIHEIRGDVAAAHQQLQTALEMAVRLRLPGEERVIRAAMAQLALRQGDWEAVKCWQAACGLTSNDLPEFQREFEHRVLAEVLLEEGQYVQAETLIARCHAAAVRSHRAGSALPLALLYAIVLARQSRLAEADAIIRSVLPMAQAQDYVRTFLDVGPHLEELLHRPSIRNLAPAYVDRLCSAFAVEQGTRRPATSPIGKSSNGHYALSPLLGEAAADIDQLTPRETEILSMIARGASNQQIADQLVLSVGTVKGHVNHIFSKLDVHNRTAAVARARSCSLLDL
jgi:LuxR family maltose regulon positive regulatory protein